MFFHGSDSQQPLVFFIFEPSYLIGLSNSDLPLINFPLDTYGKLKYAMS